MPTKEEAREWLAHALADDELAHYGVLGMKWGVRHDEPTGTSRPKAVRVSKTKDTKLTAGDKVVLGLYGTAAVAFVGPPVVAVAGAPAFLPRVIKDLQNIESHTAAVDRGKDFLNSKVNTNVPVGTVFHRVASYKETEVNAAKYATYLEDDVLRYRNSWVTPGRTYINRHYVTKMTATTNVTIASPESILREIEKNLQTILDDGENLIKKIERSATWKYVDPSMQKAILGSPSELADYIVRHNRSEIWADDVGKATSEIMQKAGYAAVTDINNTGSQARKHAVIVLQADAFKVESRLLTSFERKAAGLAQNPRTRKAATTAINLITRRRL